MSNGKYEIVCSKKYIPRGQQLHRTPLSEVKTRLDFSIKESNESLKEPREETMEVHGDNVLEAKHIDSMLKGMKGYKLTKGDLDFIKKKREEELLKKKQQELEELQSSLVQERLALEVACASREKAQAEMKKLPSCEELTAWAHVALNTSPESMDLTAKSLLAMVTVAKVQSAMDEKRMELKRMQKMLANKREKATKRKQKLGKEIAAEQLEIQKLMKELSDLRYYELAQKEEASEAAEMQIKSKGEKHQEKKRKGKPAAKARNAIKPPVAGEQEQNVGLRRSKRIASRT